MNYIRFKPKKFKEHKISIYVGLKTISKSGIFKLDFKNIFDTFNNRAPYKHITSLKKLHKFLKEN